GRAGDATLVRVLDAYYQRDAARARYDCYLRSERPFRRGAGDALAKIAVMLPGAALPRELSWTPRVADAGSQPGRRDSRPQHETLGTMHVQLPDGRERQLDVESLDDIVLMVNSALRAAGDARRLFPLDTGGGWHAYYVFTIDRASRLANVLPFAMPPHVFN